MANRRLLWRRKRKPMTGQLFRRNKPRMTSPDFSSLPDDISRPDFSSLPDDILKLILLKLECMKSVLTCMSVCKSWYALIKSPLFINTHLFRPNNNEYYFVFHQHPSCYWIDCYDSKQQRLCRYYGLKFPHREINILGSFNGLICYTKYDDGRESVYLWNPTIQKIKKIPKPVYYKRLAAFGFWFDIDSGDYKIGRIFYKKKFRVEVYSLSTNSWDMINTCSPSDPGGFSICDCDADSVVHLNGTLHWLALHRDNWFIISLNTKNGMCQKTLISPAAKEERSWFQLVKSGVQCNYLLVSRSQYHPSLCCCLLVYDESLKQLYKIDLDNDRLRMDAIGVRNNHEILFQRQGNYGNNELLICNVGESKFKRFSPPDSVHIHCLQPFVETLVLLNDEDSSSTENTGYPS